MIPKNLFFTHEDKHCLLPHVVDEWKHYNPDFTLRFYNKHERRKFIQKHYPDIFKYYILVRDEYGAMKADIWRYLVVYHYGGVYIDHKIRITRPIADFVDFNQDMCVTYKGKHRSIYTKAKALFHPEELVQYFFAAQKHSASLKKVIDLMRVRLHQQQSVVPKPLGYTMYPGTGNSGIYAVFHTTGPLMFTHALQHSMGDIHVSNHEFDCSIQYPSLHMCICMQGSCLQYLLKNMFGSSYHFCNKTLLTCSTSHEVSIV